MRSSWTRCWLEGAGAAILLAPGVMWTQLSNTHIDEFHQLLPLTTVIRALALDVVLLSLAGMLVVRGLEMWSARMAQRPSVLRRLLGVLPWAAWFCLLAQRAVTGLWTSQELWWNTRDAVWVLLGFMVVLLFASRKRGAVWAIRQGVLLLGFCIFWVVPVLAANSFLVHQQRDEAHFVQPLAARAPHQRIVWLLFDEMSYYQVFGRRWPGLQLPNLDKLRARSVTFSQMRPDGYLTEDVIPSIFLGRLITEMRGTPAGWMVYRTPNTPGWQPFDGRQSLFEDAHREGWTTGVTGDYIPYCRILKDQLDFCSMYLYELPDGLSRDKSTAANLAASLGAIAGWLPGRVDAEADVIDDPILTGPNVLPAHDVLLRDDKIDLSFIHVLLPHPPGKYHRRTKTLGPGGSYLDNLALADRLLAHLEEQIAASGAADRTTVILSSDHSWRTFMWRGSYLWTREGELASNHGQFDPRPMLMVQFPGEQTAQTIDRPVPLLAMHDLIERMMRGEVGNVQQLDAWAQRQ